MKQLFYSKYRRFNSHIHLLKFNPNDFVFEAVQMNSNQPISKIYSGWWKSAGYEKIAAINASFFPINGLNYLYEGTLFSDSKLNDEYMEICYADGKLHVGDFNFADMMKRWTNIKWAIPAGNLLVLDGQQNLTKAGMFTHSTSKHPRTMIGELANGNVVFAVAEGRNDNDEGLTSDEQSTFMLDIGCNWAVNLDGGGSSAMELEGDIVNYLDGNYQRPIANALQLYIKGTYQIVREDFTEEQEDTGIEVIGKVAIAPNFNLDEISCRCCGQVEFPNYRLMIIAQAVRVHFGKPIRLVGFRCKSHNTEIGGDPNSYHMKGEALDISAWHNDIDPIDIYNYILTLPGVKRAKYYPGSHVHIQTSWI